MELTKEQIEKINSAVPYGQGIFREPFGIPNHIKDLVVYTKWHSAGRPGSCWDDEDTINEDWYEDRPRNAFKVLDLIIEILRPNLSLSLYDELIGKFDSNQETDYGYYGDYTTDTIEFFPLSELYRFLEINTIINKNLK